MATLDYIDVPSCAIRLQPQQSHESQSVLPARKITTKLPRPLNTTTCSASTQPQPPSPTKTAMNFIPQLILSPAMNLPSVSSNTRTISGSTSTLLSTRDPLSIPITTTNFRRFVSRIGPVFWLQDRVEEVVMWKKGYKVTVLWIAVYAFICRFPRLILLLPHIIILSVMLATQSDTLPSTPTTPPPHNIHEGTKDWQANLQAIQNLMGAYSDVYDIITPYIPYMTNSSPYTPHLLNLLTLAILCSPIAFLLSFRLTLFILGLTPLLLTHPFTRTYILPSLVQTTPLSSRTLRTRLTRILDDDKLDDRHWRSEMRTVELWENERWGTDGDGWSKANLRNGERVAWTRGRDGWSGVSADGSGDVSSNLTFSLAPGWTFVETEDWRPDLEATWIGPMGGDKNGWVYTNDSWQDPRFAPADEWKIAGSTRRRRWVRRVYYCP